MAHIIPTAEVINTGNTSNVVSVNMVNVTKLSSTNYITWSAQIKSLLRGYDLLKHIDATAIPPPMTNTGSDEPNPNYIIWQRQDSLVYRSLMGSIEVANQPKIATATTALGAWTLLASTYAKPTRGHIKQIRNQLKQSVKGTKSIDEYMQQIKVKADALALLGDPMHPEDLTDAVLDGLSDDYKPTIEAVQARDTPIPFAELHEKLITRELALSTTARPLQQQLPITANHAQNRSNNWRGNNNRGGHSNRGAYNNNDNRGSRPYLGMCQACGTQGHSAKRCPMFRVVPQSSNSAPRTSIKATTTTILNRLYEPTM